MVSYFVNIHFMVMFSEQYRLSDEKNVDPEVDKKIDIGFPALSAGGKVDKRKDRMSYVKSQRQSADLEKQARMQTRNFAVCIFSGTYSNRIIYSRF